MLHSAATSRRLFVIIVQDVTTLHCRRPHTPDPHAYVYCCYVAQMMPDAATFASERAIQTNVCYLAPLRLISFFDARFTFFRASFVSPFIFHATLYGHAIVENNHHVSSCHDG